MEFLGKNQVPFARVFTKSDKVKRAALKKSIQHYDELMLCKWETLPVTFVSSAANKAGREEILGFIEETFNNLSKED
jgi:GTP-binding protein